MNKLYLFLAVCALVCGAYFYGMNLADAKCRARFSQQNLQSIQNYQNQIMKNKRQTDEIIYKTSVRDIRRVLRDKYSIAD